jgi:hypothetical protein
MTQLFVLNYKIDPANPRKISVQEKKVFTKHEKSILTSSKKIQNPSLLNKRELRLRKIWKHGKNFMGELNSWMKRMKMTNRLFVKI